MLQPTDNKFIRWSKLEKRFVVEYILQKQQNQLTFSFDDMFHHKGLKITEFNKNNVKQQPINDIFCYEKFFKELI